MTRSKKAASTANGHTSNPLKDCCIAFATNRMPAGVLNGQTMGDIKKLIISKEGTISTSADQASDCTHLVATDAQYSKQTGNVSDGINNKEVKIVSFDWLEAALASKTPVDESQYILHSRATSAKANGGSSTATSTTDAPKPSKKSKKRGRTDDSDEDEPKVTNKRIKSEDPEDTEDQEDEQKAKPASLNVPVDEGVTNGVYKVHVADDGTVLDATLNQTNSGNNNNKFYRIQLLQNSKGKFYCWTRWGRVGEFGQSKMLGAGSFDEAMGQFGKKFKDKNGNTWDNRDGPTKAGKYSFIERSYEDSDEEDVKDASPLKRRNSKASVSSEEAPVESKLLEPVQRLMGLIFNQEYFASTLASLNYDANKMPLGKLSKKTLLRGYDVLKELAILASGGGAGSAGNAGMTDLSNQYFSLIPHSFGRNRPPILHDMQSIKREIELLENLTDMQLANDIMKVAKGDKDKQAERMHLLDRQFQGLGMQEMTPLDSTSAEFSELETYLLKSAGSTHHIGYKVQDVFRIERDGESQRFGNSKYAKMSNSDRRLLWHGSRCTNFGGILSQGLRIAPPEAPVSGYMFGKGVYLADMSTKSANYCNSYSSGNIGLLLLCEAELGKPPLKLSNADYNAGELATKQGSISTLGIGQTIPQGWKDASCVNKNLKGVLMPDVKIKPPGPTDEANAWLQYNEYIVYDVAQIKLRYLLRVEIK